MSFLQGLFGGDRGRETQSVILLRQVPIRFDERARSWLGGLPQMPEGVAWPRTAAGAPLQFVAQVSCADLPKGMWGGIGPRKGWLLLFVDCYAKNSMEIDGSIVQVLHVTELGPEREPPEDMGTYRHAMLDHIDCFRPVVRPGIPKMWRRWPVDLIVQDVPPLFEVRGEMILAPAQANPLTLYGAPVADEAKGSLRLTVTGKTRPLTWRGVLYLLDKIAHRLESQAASQVSKLKWTESAKGRPDRFPSGWVAQALANVEVQMANYAKPLANWESRAKELRSNGEGAEEALKELETTISTRARALKGLAATIALLKTYTSADAEADFSRDVAHAEHDHLAWIERMQRLVAEVRGEVLCQDHDQLLTDADWLPVRDRLAASTSKTWYIVGEKPDPSRIVHNLLSEASNPMGMALREEVLDLYTRDAASRAAIPQDLLDELEPQVRRIGVRDVPHRMGGPRDVVQDEEPRDGRMLLFQIFSDHPMGWMWADAGGLFVFIPIEDLKAGRFDAVEAWVEGH